MASDPGPWLVGKRCTVRVPRDQRQPRTGVRRARPRARAVRRGRGRGAARRPGGHGRRRGRRARPARTSDHLVVRALLAAADALRGRPHHLACGCRRTTRSRTAAGSGRRPPPSSPESPLFDLLAAPADGPARDLLPCAGAAGGPSGQRGRGAARRTDHRLVRAGLGLGPGRAPPAALRDRTGRARARAPAGHPARPRPCCPGTVSHDDAARTAGRAALLVHALTSGPRPAAAGDRGLAAPAAPGRGHAATRSGWSEPCGPTVRPRSCPAPDRACWCCASATTTGARARGRTAPRPPPAGWRAMAPGIAFQGTRGGRARASGRAQHIDGWIVGVGKPGGPDSVRLRAHRRTRSPGAPPMFWFGPASSEAGSHPVPRPLGSPRRQ